MTTTAVNEHGVVASKNGFLDRLAKKLVVEHLAGIEEGTLELTDGDERTRFGSPAADGLRADLRILHPSFYRSLLFGGSLGGAEAYLDGHWDSDDLTSVVRVLARNRGAVSRLDGRLSRLAALAARVYHTRRSNTRDGSRRNIRDHYDLGNELFERFLDPTMTYSAAFFAEPSMSLEEAQRAKLDRICRKLGLGAEDHVLEIGTGWGSFAIHAASTYGCRVTTTTISPSQLAEASRRVAAAGLEDRVELLERDYRDLEGEYDKLVSIEMIEAVGHEYFGDFFATCSRLLKPDGLMALQAITIADRNYEQARRSVDFIQRYIFPGGAIPSVAAMTAAIASASDLTPLHIEELGLDYAETLRRWRERFENEWPAIERLGFDERFRRLWRYYFSYCEGGFLERAIGDVQLVLAKPDFRAETVKGQL